MQWRIMVKRRGSAEHDSSNKRDDIKKEERQR